MYIIGKEYCKLDSNGRFKLPIAIKKQLEEGEMEFVIRESNFLSCLELWTVKSFQEYIAELHEKLNPFDMEDHEMLSQMSDGNIIALDSADRLVIPPEQKHVLNGQKDIVLRSVGNWIEIWDQETYTQKQSSSKKEAALRIHKRLGGRPETKQNESHE